jgi:hypothetical protein
MKQTCLIIIIINLTFLSSCDKKNSQVQIKNPVEVNLKALLVDVTPIERKFYDAKHEPAQGILHGAGQDFNGFKDYATAVGQGKHPIIYMDYIGLTKSKIEVAAWGLKIKNDLSQLPADIIPQIGLNMTGGNDNGSGQVGAIASGAYDEQITAFAQAMKNLNRKSFVRIGYEFEGSWNGYQPVGYVAAFKKVTTALRAIDSNAATVWCFGGGSAGFKSWTELSEYYPGDEWVDWWGVDIFSPEELTDNRLVAFLQKSDEHGKPIMMGEATPRYVGVADGELSWGKWFHPFFELLYQNPQIKVTGYINWDWLYWSNALGFQWKDWKDVRI